MTDVYPVGSFVQRVIASTRDPDHFGYAGQVAEVVFDDGFSLRVKFLTPRHRKQRGATSGGIGVTRSQWKPI